MSKQILVATLLWVVTLWRLPAVRHSHKQRSLALTFAALATSQTFDLAVVQSAVDAMVPFARLAPLLKQVLGVASAALLLDFVVAVVRPEGFARRFRLSAILTAVPLMLVFYTLANWVPATIHAGRGPYSLFAVLYIAVFTLYIGTSMVVATWLFIGGARHSRSVWTRSGLALLGLGTGVGSLYAFQRVVFVALNMITDTVHAELENVFSTDLKLIAIVSIALGSCLPPIAGAIEAVKQWRYLRDLEPLWRGLIGGAPQVVLSTPIPRRRLSMRLHRRIIEIGDASLALREYVPAELQRQAKRQAATAGNLEGETADAVAEAMWLHVATQTARHAAPLPNTEHPMPGGIGKGYEAELQWLRAVSHAYRTSPLVDSFAPTPPLPKLLHTDDDGMFLHD
ncbi:MAB_1171c family putative transporter [Streptomyces sp. 21So2-11]|uniref:MAB_1171c family putative transporter n=1 Tax=Streptomyces sp. 21So2-11 TaxID=3144408 RepID=UPI00321B93DE